MTTPTPFNDPEVSAYVRDVEAEITRLKRDLAAAQDARDIAVADAIFAKAAMDSGEKLLKEAQVALKAAEERAERAEAAITRARRVMGGEGVADEAEAWDQCLRILDAAIAAGEGK